MRDAFLLQVDVQPDNTALLWHDQRISYRELHEMALKAIDQLTGLRLIAGEPVGVLARKSPAAIALVLACVITDRPFLLPSTALAEQTVITLLRQANCRYALVSDGDPLPVPSTDSQSRRGFDGQDVLFMLTTSGSTGLPKIVPLTSSAVDRFTAWASDAFEIGPGRSVLSYAPLNFDLSLLDVWTTLAHGGQVVLVAPEHAVSGEVLLGLLSRHEVHVAQAVPMFYSLLSTAARADGSGRRFPTVEHVAFTGDAIPNGTLRQLPELFPSARFYNIYGCTETNDSFVHEVDRRACSTGGPLPIGTPLPGVRAAVLTEDGAVLRGGGTGELYVSTPFQTKGYLNRPDQQDRFVQHPGGWDDNRYFRTGDLVRRDESGQFFLLGRNDFQVKIRGIAINTAEVEGVLLDHPDVREVAVAVRDDDVVGGVLLCAVQRRPASGLNSLTLRKHCADRLPRAAIPSIMKIGDEPLPKGATGKIDRRAIVQTRATTTSR